MNDLEKARKELAILKEREKELEMRLGITNPPSVLQNSSSDIPDLKQREKELEKKLGLKRPSSPLQNSLSEIPNSDNSTSEMDEQLSKRQNNQKIIYIDINRPEDNYDLKMKNNLSVPKINSPATLNYEEGNSIDITDNESISIHLSSDIIYEENYNTDEEFEAEVFPDDEHEYNHATFQNGRPVDHNNNYIDESTPVNSNDEYSENENESIHAKDLREDIRKDIIHNKQREIELKYERGAELQQYDESDSDISQSIQEQIDIRAKILKEIEEEKIRDLEIQAKYRQEGFPIDNDHDSFDKTKIIEPKDTKIILEQEILELKERENELRKKNGIVGIISRPASQQSLKNIDPREKIEMEFIVQKKREEELKRLRQQLDQVNLGFLTENHSESDSDLENESEIELNTREKILREIDEMNKRESELKKQADIQINDSENNSLREELDYVQVQKLQREKEHQENPLKLKKRGNLNRKKTKELQQIQNNSIKKLGETIFEKKKNPLLKKIAKKDSFQKKLNRKFDSREDLIFALGNEDTNSDGTITPQAKEDHISITPEATQNLSQESLDQTALQNTRTKLRIPKIFMAPTNQKEISFIDSIDHVPLISYDQNESKEIPRTNRKFGKVNATYNGNNFDEFKDNSLQKHSNRAATADLFDTEKNSSHDRVKFDNSSVLSSSTMENQVTLSMTKNENEHDNIFDIAVRKLTGARNASRDKVKDNQIEIKVDPFGKVAQRIKSQNKKKQINTTNSFNKANNNNITQREFQNGNSNESMFCQPVTNLFIINQDESQKIKEEMTTLKPETVS